jgi:response regulator RpfG family c-di-GMP phosphodiesterase
MKTEPNTILVVDDEAVIRELITDILGDEGYIVITADSGRSALEILEKPNDIVLLFTDIMMPEMDGIELIRASRKIQPSIVPIVMTGYATLETARAAVKEGAYDYVLKPFSLSEIKLAVNNALDRYKLERENARLPDLTGLFKISESIAAIHDEEILLKFVLEASLEHVGAERGSIMMTSGDGKCLELAASVGLEARNIDRTVAMEGSISGWVARNNLPLCVQDLADTPEFSGLSNHLEDKSFMSIPMESSSALGVLEDKETPSPKDGKQSQVLAVLNVNQKTGGRSFTDGDLKILNIIANQAAVAIENVRLMQEIESAHMAALHSMARVLEAKDQYTHGHSERVRNYAVMAAQHMGLSIEDQATIRLGAMLHDVGKIGVSDAILNKIEKLTDEEWDQIKLHPVIGFDVLKPVAYLTPEHLALIRSHHERLDGTGYPDGLTADQQDIRVRILAVADTYDAMSGDRAYRKGLSAEKILSELEYCASSQKLDPDVVKHFIDLINNGEIYNYAENEPVIGHPLPPIQ